MPILFEKCASNEPKYGKVKTARFMILPCLIGLYFSVGGNHMLMKYFGCFIDDPYD